MKDQAMLAAVAADVALGYLLPCLGLLACGMLARRRLAACDADWRATEPRVDQATLVHRMSRAGPAAYLIAVPAATTSRAAEASPAERRVTLMTPRIGGSGADTPPISRLATPLRFGDTSESQKRRGELA